MSYVLDINRVRIQKAMICLGIEADELKKKNLEDFFEKNVNEDIQNLRYSFFTRKQEELVRQIKACVKQEIIRYHEEKKQQSNNLSTLETFESTDNPEDELEKVKKKHKEHLTKHYEQVKESIQDFQAIETKLVKGQKAREEFRLSENRQQLKMKEFKQKQQENYKHAYKQKNLYPVSVSRADFHSFTPLRNSSKKQLSQSPNSVSRSDSKTEFEISTKIKKFEEKMDKSKALYNVFLQNKKEAITKILQKSLKGYKASENEKNQKFHEQFNKVILKNLVLEERRSQCLKVQTEKKLKQKQILDERSSRAKNNLEKKEKLFNLRSKTIEKKIERNNTTLQKKQDK